MAESKTDSESEDQPGKTRTWWHPLLVRMIDWTLAGAYEVREEVNVGRMPLRVDIVLIERADGVLPELATRQLASIAKRLNRYTNLKVHPTRSNLETWTTRTASGSTSPLTQIQWTQRLKN